MGCFEEYHIVASGISIQQVPKESLAEVVFVSVEVQISQYSGHVASL